MDTPAATDAPNNPNADATASAVVSDTTLDRSESSSTLDLFHAAIGPIGWAHYQKAFIRFDAKDRAGLGWNWAAALLTVQWMAFRQLWGAALSYIGLLVAATLLIFGIGRLVFHFSPEVEWALMASGLLLAFGVPGALGDALLYNACRKKMAKALEANTTVTEACTVLQRQASTRLRLVWIALATIFFAGAVLGVSLALPDADKLPMATPKMGQARNATPGAVALGTVTDPSQQQAKLAASAPVAAPITAPASAPVSAPTTATSAPASAPVAAPLAKSSVAGSSPERPASASSSAAPAATSVTTAAATSAAASAAQPVATPKPSAALTPMPGRSTWSAAMMMPPTASPAASPAASTASTPPTPASGVASSPPPARAASAASSPAARVAPSAAPTSALAKAATMAEAPTAKVASAPRAKASDVSVASKVPKLPKLQKAPNASAQETAAPATFVVNVGLFADENNARNAHTKLVDAGLPAYQQAVKGPRGRFTRVRVGPFDTEVEAQTAAEKIQALGLDAMVAKP